MVIVQHFCCYFPNGSIDMKVYIKFTPFTFYFIVYLFHNCNILTEIKENGILVLHDLRIPHASNKKYLSPYTVFH